LEAVILLKVRNSILVDIFSLFASIIYRVILFADVIDLFFLINGSRTFLKLKNLYCKI